jgi:hypothetical protein
VPKTRNQFLEMGTHRELIASFANGPKPLVVLGEI